MAISLKLVSAKIVNIYYHKLKNFNWNAKGKGHQFYKITSNVKCKDYNYIIIILEYLLITLNQVPSPIKGQLFTHKTISWCMGKFYVGSMFGGTSMCWVKQFFGENLWGQRAIDSANVECWLNSSWNLWDSPAFLCPGWITEDCLRLGLPWTEG